MNLKPCPFFGENLAMTLRVLGGALHGEHGWRAKAEAFAGRRGLQVMLGAGGAGGEE